MDISVSGFREEGDWKDIVDHGKRITHLLEDHDGTSEDELEDWNEWRPKPDETLDKEVTEKTAESVSVGKGEGEKKGKKPTDDIKKASEKTAKSTANIKDAGKKAPRDPSDAADQMNEAGDKLQDGAGYFARAIDSISRKMLRKLETVVYSRIMTYLSPYYFDNSLISANIQQKRNLLDNSEEEFVFEININDDAVKEDVKRELTDEDGDPISLDESDL